MRAPALPPVPATGEAGIGGVGGPPVTPVPPDARAGTDPCALLTDAEVSRATGVPRQGISGGEIITGHATCAWFSTDAAEPAVVKLSVGPSPGGLGEPYRNMRGPGVERRSDIGDLAVADPSTPDALHVYVGNSYLWLVGVTGPARDTLARLAVSRVR